MMSCEGDRRAAIFENGVRLNLLSDFITALFSELKHHSVLITIKDIGSLKK